MAPSTEDESLERMLRALAARDRRDVVEEAAAEARAEAKRILRERLVELLLEGTEAPGPTGTQPRDSGPPEDRPSVQTVIDSLQHGADGSPPDPDPGPDDPGTSDSDATGLYVYGIVERSSRLPAHLPPGVGGATAVRLLPADGVQAVVSEVPMSQFGRDALRANLDDPTWLEAAVRAHEAILARLRDGVTVLPLRFGTVFGDEIHATEVLAARSEAFRADLERLRGRAEWGLKVLSDWSALVAWIERNDDEIARQRSESDGATEGRAFFLRRRLESARADEAARLQRDVATEAHLRLSEVAEDAVAPDVATSGGSPGPLLAGAAYLVERSREGELRRAAEELQRRYGPAGFTVRLTGPWAPYSFASSSRADETS
ncbi:MAG: GvpL/GvpF family gas vesicle protein [Actinomycetota bacterium]